jgi:hypothetical protein
VPGAEVDVTKAEAETRTRYLVPAVFSLDYLLLRITELADENEAWNVWR